MKFTKNKPLLIGILAVLLVVLFFGTQNTFFGQTYIYNSSATLSGESAIAYSTAPFIENSTTYPQPSKHYSIITTKNSFDDSGVHLTASKVNGRYEGNFNPGNDWNPTMESFYTYVVTNNLNINSDYQTISFNFIMNNVLNCNADDQSYNSPSLIALVDGEKQEDLVVNDIKSNTRTSSASSMKQGQVTVNIVDNKATVNIKLENSTDTRTFNIDENSTYELAVGTFASQNTCGNKGHSIIADVSISNLQLEKKETAPPLPPGFNENVVTPNQNINFGSGVTNDNLFLGLIIAGIVIIVIIIILLFRKR